uniref:Uncharacterized protein n=1 Tax=Podoviridae sp. ctG4L18 TaxID=2825234 RepID=A0A8S5UNV6_9CAUD|nr:MAG TPA: hypothetical protein [Podoviridae sp. ctG4L18]
MLYATRESNPCNVQCFQPAALCSKLAFFLIAALYLLGFLKTLLAKL